MPGQGFLRDVHCAQRQRGSRRRLPENQRPLLQGGCAEPQGRHGVEGAGIYGRRFPRFLYVNVYAFALLGLGALVFIMPTGVFLEVVKILFAAVPAFLGVALLSQWKAKSRRMRILVARNRKVFRPDTFREMSRTLCGRLMVDLVLRDLRKTENHGRLSKAEWKEMRRKAFGGKAGAARKKSANTVGVKANQGRERGKEECP